MSTIDNKYQYIISYFQEHNPNAVSELKYENPFQLLVAVVLSAQCTDKRVNMVTPKLFAKYPTPDALSQATVSDIYEYIKSISYPNNKAKHLHALASMLVSDFNGMVPSEMDELQRLPGVGRKTANVMLSVVFDKPAMAVDTHVFRLAHRIGMVENAPTPLEVEKQLVAHFPSDILSRAHHWLILHGRYVCFARKPQCPDCGLQSVCDYFQKQKNNNQ